MISIALAAAALIAAVVVWRAVPSLRSWPPALGLLLAVLTVVPPHQTVALGIGADDLLLLLGLMILAPPAWRAYRAHAIPRPPYAGWLAAGAGLLVAGMVVSAFVNGTSTGDILTLVARGPARILLYVFAVVLVIGQLPADRVRFVVARAVAGLATFEAAVGLVAYTIGFPGGFGLEDAQGNTALLGEIPGRINGTLGLSPNFLGALFVLSIPITLGLALDAEARSREAGGGRETGSSRAPWLWGLGALVQMVGLVLTYTRASLLVMLLACGVIAALRFRLRWLALTAAVIGGLLWITESLTRIVSDHTDRLALYASAVRVFFAHPIAGVGPGEQADFTAADPQRFRVTEFGVAGNNAHNTILLAAAENGVLGLVGALILNVALVLLAVAVIRRARTATGWNPEALAVGVGVLAFLLQGMTNNLFTVTLTATMLMLVVAGCAVPWLVADVRPGADAVSTPEPTGRSR